MHYFRYVGNQLYCEGVSGGNARQAKSRDAALHLFPKDLDRDIFRKLDQALAAGGPSDLFRDEVQLNQAVLRFNARGPLGGGFDYRQRRRNCAAPHEVLCR